MRRFLLAATGLAICIGTSAFAATGTNPAQSQLLSLPTEITIPSQEINSAETPAFAVAKKDEPPTTPPGNSGNNGNNGNNGNGNGKNKPQCDDVTPSHPCKGNNGFGNGGNDGSPNGKEDNDR